MKPPAEEVAGGTSGGDDQDAPVVSVPPALLHGTIAELESWLRAQAAGRTWYPQATCQACRNRDHHRTRQLRYTAGKLDAVAVAAGDHGWPVDPGWIAAQLRDLIDLLDLQRRGWRT